MPLKPFTTLGVAADAGDLTRVKARLAAGDDVNEPIGPDQYTPLHLAAINGFTEVAVALCDGGADVDAKDWDNGTPLFRAAFNGHTEVALALLERGIDVDMKNRNNWTPLHLAASLHSDCGGPDSEWGQR
mmetsp:Transcript_11973/g.36153  ORF Transcript_11973/g.36153 Transcript_11973/m.36153 type:complete len:130 (-) Transcript_11973:302-691(-)